MLGHLVAQSVGHPVLAFGSGPDLKPCVGLHAQQESTGYFLPLPLPPLAFSLSLVNKYK